MRLIPARFGDLPIGRLFATNSVYEKFGVYRKNTPMTAYNLIEQEQNTDLWASFYPFETVYIVPSKSMK
jgi:hypothetical protein